MKYIIKPRFYTIAVFLLLSIMGCQKVLDVNTDPNNPSTANPEQLLPAAQVEMASALYNAYAFTTSMWAQYWTSGTTISTTPVEFFTLVGGDIDRSYQRSYSRALQDYAELIKSDQPVYAGMAKILTAYTMQNLVDLHGDVPYSEALKGEIADGAITTPKFDKSEDIYASLIPLIDEGLLDLQKTGPTVRFPEDQDLVYAGDLDKWVAFANTLKLKILVRQSFANTAKLNEASTLIASGAPLIDGTNAATVYFDGASKGNSNPLWARFESRDATKMYMRASQTSIDVLLSLADPRVGTIFKKGSDPGYTGINQGESNNPPYKASANTKYAEPNPTYVYNPSVPVFLISSWESKFLQAEVLARKSDGAAQATWEAGIEESFNYYELNTGSALADYIGALTFGATVDDQIKSIAIQKWIAMNGLQMNEGWIETRRFDRESEGKLIFRGSRTTEGTLFYSPTQNALGTDKFPSIFVYPLTEVQYNPNCPKNRTVTDKVFWDN